MTEQLDTGEARPRRRLRALALVAVLVAVLVSALPGTASAAVPQVVPLINCYYAHSDGSVTVVLGYRSTHPNTKTIARGARNYANPSKYGTSLPTTFKPGTNNGVATVRIAAGELTATTAWFLDGSVLNYASAVAGVSVCTQAQLPAFANGAAIAIALLVAGLVGVLVVRRLRRNLLQPRSTNPSAQGGHSA